MAKEKLQFRPDPSGSSLWSKLYITPTQRKIILKWALYCLLCVAVLTVQDVILSRFSLFGGTFDVIIMVMLMICVLEDAQNGGSFLLWMSVFYLFSGSAPGPYCIFFLTCYGILVSIFRQNFLQHSFSAHMICTVTAGFAYQISIFGMGLFLTHTYPGRFGAFLMNAVLGAAVLPLLYPALTAIRKIGGTSWKE